MAPYVPVTLFCYAVTVGACYYGACEVYEEFTFCKRRDKMLEQWDREEKERKKVLREQCELGMKLLKQRK